MKPNKRELLSVTWSSARIPKGIEFGQTTKFNCAIRKINSTNNFLATHAFVPQSRYRIYEFSKVRSFPMYLKWMKLHVCVHETTCLFHRYLILLKYRMHGRLCNECRIGKQVARLQWNCREISGFRTIICFYLVCTLHNLKIKVKCQT